MEKDKIEEALWGVYEQGLNDAWEAARDIGCVVVGLSNATLEEIFGTCIVDSILRENLATEAVKKISDYKKRNSYQVGDIIADDNRRLLIVRITDKSYECMSGNDFEPVYIGKDYICQYRNMHDRKDIGKIIEKLGGLKE